MLCSPLSEGYSLELALKLKGWFMKLSMTCLNRSLCFESLFFEPNLFETLEVASFIWLINWSKFSCSACSIGYLDHFQGSLPLFQLKDLSKWDHYEFKVKSFQSFHFTLCHLCLDQPFHCEIGHLWWREFLSSFEFQMFWLIYHECLFILKFLNPYL